jgi:hypothetical protein
MDFLNPRISDRELRLIDFGGLKVAGRNVHQFEFVSAVIFMFSLDEYNEKNDDSSLSRLEGAVDLFREVARSHWFRSTFKLVFMNKTDLFKEDGCLERPLLRLLRR